MMHMEVDQENINDLHRSVEKFKRKASRAVDSERVIKRSFIRNITNEIQNGEHLFGFPNDFGKNLCKNPFQQFKTTLDINSEEKESNNEEVPDVRVSYRPVPHRDLPPGVEYDFDLENWEDINGVPDYASEVFEYFKSREKNFQVEDYIETQPEVTPLRRSILVDWMVSVQQSFKLNHETLYRAVKIVDLYLMNNRTTKGLLQLVAMASLSISCKYDEVEPATTEDFLYICENAYTAKEFTSMELEVLKAVDYSIGIPDSYSFLRRYAECAKVDMPELLLARYILEYSLMNYVCISFSESKMAAAALYLAMQMKDTTKIWTPTLVYHSGYQVSEFRHIVYILNDNLRKPFKNCEAIATKYSSKNYLKVAYTPMIQNYEIKF